MPRSQKSGKDVDVVMEVDGAGEERGASGKKPKTVRKKTKTQSFHLYINKTLKQVHPEVGMKKAAMAVLNSMVHDMLDKVANEASSLHRNRAGVTITENDVKTAVRLLYPGDLSQHAIKEADKALATLSSGNRGNE